MRAARWLCAALCGAAALPVAAADVEPPRAAAARDVELPLRVDYPFLRRLAVETIFDGPDESARPWRDASGCNRIALAQPALFATDGELHLRARYDARLGAGVGGACGGTTRRSGLFDARLEPRLHPELPIVEFRVAHSELLDADGAKRAPGRIWEVLRAQVHPRLETLRVDLTRPLGELRAFLPLLVPAGDAALWQRGIDALALEALAVEADALALGLRLPLPDPPVRPPAPDGPEPALTPAELARWESAWKSWDAFLTFLIRHGLRDADAALRRELREVLIDARTDVEAILLAPQPRAAEPVRSLFVETWTRLAPLLRRVAAELPGDSALGYVSLLAAADAYAALDRIGPEYGVELSVDGMRRMARMLDATSTDPTRYDDEVDPELRELLGFGPPLPLPGEEPDTDADAADDADATGPDEHDAEPDPAVPPPGARLDPGIRAARGLALLRVAGAPRSLDTWVPRRGELLDYLARVRELLVAVALETRRDKRLGVRHTPLFRSLVLATAWQESCWRQVTRRGGEVRPLTSGVGAVGIMQVHQRVWRGLYDVNALRSSMRYNARAGSEILHHYLVDYAIARREHEVRKDPDDLARATYAAYNAGPRQLRRYRTPHGGVVGHAIDRSFAEKYRRVQAGDELAVASCYPGFAGSA